MGDVETGMLIARCIMLWLMICLAAGVTFLAVSWSKWLWFLVPLPFGLVALWATTFFHP